MARGILPTLLIIFISFSVPLSPFTSIALSEGHFNGDPTLPPIPKDPLDEPYAPTPELDEKDKKVLEARDKINEYYDAQKGMDADEKVLGHAYAAEKAFEVFDLLGSKLGVLESDEEQRKKGDDLLAGMSGLDQTLKLKGTGVDSLGDIPELVEKAVLNGSEEDKDKLLALEKLLNETAARSIADDAKDSEKLNPEQVMALNGIRQYIAAHLYDELSQQKDKMKPEEVREAWDRTLALAPAYKIRAGEFGFDSPISVKGFQDGKNQDFRLSRVGDTLMFQANGSKKGYPAVYNELPKGKKDFEVSTTGNYWDPSSSRFSEQKLKITSSIGGKTKSYDAAFIDGQLYRKVESPGVVGGVWVANAIADNFDPATGSIRWSGSDGKAGGSTVGSTGGSTGAPPKPKSVDTGGPATSYPLNAKGVEIQTSGNFADGTRPLKIVQGGKSWDAAFINGELYQKKDNKWVLYKSSPIGGSSSPPISSSPTFGSSPSSTTYPSLGVPGISNGTVIQSGMPTYGSYGGYTAPTYGSYGGYTAPTYGSYGGYTTPTYGSYGGGVHVPTYGTSYGSYGGGYGVPTYGYGSYGGYGGGSAYYPSGGQIQAPC